MTSETIYEIWSRWVKPVVFPFLRPEVHDRADYSIKTWQILVNLDTAVIADLPGAEGVSAGIAMARAGYRPVLMYNACPNADFDGVSPKPEHIANTQCASPPVVVDMSSILTAVCAAAKELASLPLSEDAPPVFLLDGNRSGFRGEPGWFDNRSFVASSDFPSGDYFRRNGISRAILGLVHLPHQFGPSSRSPWLTARRHVIANQLLGSRGSSPCRCRSPDVPALGMDKALPKLRLPAQRLSFILRRIDPHSSA